MVRPPAIASTTETGALGVYHLKRLWSSAIIQQTGASIDRKDEWHLDRLVIDALGLGLQKALEYLYLNNPTFSEFEEWIVATAGKPERICIDRLNADIAVTPHSQHTRQWLDTIENSKPVLSDDDLSFWAENGYVILKEAVTETARIEAEKTIWEYVAADPAEPESWYKTTEPGIMVELIQHPELEKNRRSTRIHKAFAQLWGTADLWITADRCGFHVPQCEGWPFPSPDIHWDLFKRHARIFTLRIFFLLAFLSAGQAQQTVHTSSSAIHIPLVILPGGTFIMGDTGAAEGEPAELPVHEVTIAPFAISAYEITQVQYEAIMGYNPSYSKGQNKPVETVSWYDAVRFCNILSRLDSLEPAYRIDPVEGYTPIPNRNGYRLPKEAEWEYAAKAGTATDTYAGDLTVTEGPDSLLDQIAWYFVDVSNRYTREAGRKTPNSFGLYDMLGNVWEWTDDWFAKYDNPATQQALKVLRGGAMDAVAYANRASYRYRLHPSYTSYNIGFRIARSIEE